MPSEFPRSAVAQSQYAPVQDKAASSAADWGPLDAWCIRLIRFKASQMVGKAGLTKSDRRDLEQQLATDVLARLPKFDPAKAGFHTFVDRVVNHAVATILAHRGAAVRDYRRTGPSLNEEVALADGSRVQRIKNVAEEDPIGMRTVERRTQRELAELKLDLMAATARLPERLRSLCEMLKSMDMPQIIRQSGRSKSSLYRDVAEIRGVFKDAGLEEHLRRK
ncbi:MAG: sigma-70 family RNA polymerase sigma factor [Phycisphaerae bacterium]